jgi:hypothetical protein
MEKKRKIAVAISSHSPAPFTQMTVGSLISACSNSNDLNIHIGVHSNIDHYTHDLSLFDETRNLAHIHLVDEIDWMAHNSDVYRYSRMHAKNLENILKHIRFYDFEYLLLLDNDLLIKRDFISELLEKYPGSDLIGHYFVDQTTHNTVNELMAGETIQMMPKCSVWCTLISRKLFDRIVTDPSLIYPERVDDYDRKVNLTNLHPTLNPELPVIFDTFSKILLIEDEGWNFKMLSENEVMGDTYHFTASSFNYGGRQGGIDRKLDLAWEMYRKVFPEGLSPLKI